MNIFTTHFIDFTPSLSFSFPFFFFASCDWLLYYTVSSSWQCGAWVSSCGLGFKLNQTCLAISTSCVPPYTEAWQTVGQGFCDWASGQLFLSIACRLPSCLHETRTWGWRFRTGTNSTSSLCSINYDIISRQLITDSFSDPRLPPFLIEVSDIESRECAISIPKNLPIIMCCSVSRLFQP